MVPRPATRLMRIVAHNGSRIWGGAECATVMLLRGLGDRGHDVRLLCNDDVVQDKAEARGVRAEICRVGGDIAFPHVLRLSKVLKKHEPDAFIIGTWKKLFLASLGARLAHVPRVVARVGLETDTPRSAKYRFALRRWVHGVAVNAERMIGPFTSLEGFGARRVTLIHNGVRKPRMHDSSGTLRAQLGIPVDAFVVGSIARLTRQKRIDRLLQAVALTDASVHCIVAGEGEERALLFYELARLGLSLRVHLIGHREETGNVLDALDALVITSDREGLSNSMLEAMAFGLPVISTPVSGATDALGGDSPAGIIVKFDAASVAAGMDQLRRSPSRRAEIGRAAQHRAETTFSFETMLDRWEALLAV